VFVCSTGLCHFKAAQPTTEPDAPLSKMDIADAIKTLCVIGDLPDYFDDVADWIVKGEIPTLVQATESILIDGVSYIVPEAVALEMLRLHMVIQASEAQPAPVQEPVAILNHAHGVHVFRSVNLKGLPDGEYQVYTTPPAQPAQQDEDELTIAYMAGVHRGKELAAQPAPAVPVPLTDEQINAIWSARDLPVHRSDLSPFGMERVRAIIDAALGATAGRPAAETKPAVQDGWQLVPVEPTKEMLDAVVTSMDEHLHGPNADQQYIDDWRAMLAAAPKEGGAL